MRSKPAPQRSGLVKPFWASVIGPPWVIALAVYAAVACVRFIAFQSPWSLQEIYFLQTLALWALPFVLLTREGRHKIGLTGTRVSPASTALSLLAGAACGLIFFSLGMAIYGNTPNNWCISVRNYLHLDEMRGLMSPVSLFALYALPAIFLNPIGEEIFFRGFVQESFGRRFTPVVGVLVNASLFGLLYLYLHGLWRDAAGFHLRAGSAGLAVFLIACTGCVYTLCRNLSGSLWSALAAHAAFNLAILGMAIHQFTR